MENIAKKVTIQLESIDKNRDKYWGYLHGDHNTVNHFFDPSTHPESIKIFDTDLCGRGPRVYDLAVPLWTRRFDRMPNNKHFQQVLEGYRSIHTLSEEEENAIPSYVIARHFSWMRSISDPSFNPDLNYKKFWKDAICFFQDPKITEHLR